MDWKIQIRIASALKQWMADNNFDFYDASDTIGISKRRLVLLTKQQGSVGINELILLSKALKTTTDFLLCIDQRS